MCISLQGAKSSLLYGWVKLLPLHAAAWDVAHLSVSQMVNAPDATRPQLVKAWRESILAQLSQGAVMSAAVVGSFSWPSISTMSTVPLIMIRITWYSSLVCGIMAVATALQQSVFLVRVGCVSDSELLICRLLSSDSAQGRRPRQHQIFVWQAAVGMLEWCIFLWIGGYIVFIWDQTLILQRSQQTSDQV
ncbi:hypothetical protein LLEC1_04399, partial [Akanthomyces lecanii]